MSIFGRRRLQIAGSAWAFFIFMMAGATSSTAADVSEPADSYIDPVSLAVIDPALAPSLESRFDYYSDSDGSRTLSSTATERVPVGDFTFVRQNDRVYASDPKGRLEAGDTVYSVYTELNEFWGFGGGLGTVRTNAASQILVGSIRSTAKLLGADIEGAFSHDMLMTTAETIRNRISVTNFSLAGSRELFDHLSMNLSYRRQLYSDHNAADALEASWTYGVSLAHSWFGFGYRAKYWNYQRSIQSGYFAPQNFFSNEGFCTLSFDRGWYYGSITSSIGRQSFNNLQRPGGGVSGAGAGGLGIRISPSMLIEISATAGNYALGNATGWNYLDTGIRFNYLL